MSKPKRSWSSQAPSERQAKTTLRRTGASRLAMTPAKKSWPTSTPRGANHHERLQAAASSPRRAGRPGARLHAQAQRSADGQRDQQRHQPLNRRHRQLSRAAGEGEEGAPSRETPARLRPQGREAEMTNQTYLPFLEGRGAGHRKRGLSLDLVPASALEKRQVVDPPSGSQAC